MTPQKLAACAIGLLILLCVAIGLMFTHDSRIVISGVFLVSLLMLLELALLLTEDVYEPAQRRMED